MAASLYEASLEEENLMYFWTNLQWKVYLLSLVLAMEVDIKTYLINSNSVSI